MKVKIGDKIRHSLFGGEVLTGIVEDIQICRQGEKSGYSVKTTDMKKHHGVIDLDNGHWCYFHQVINKISDGNKEDNKE